jgi:hypothetical protein
VGSAIKINGQINNRIDKKLANELTEIATKSL